MAQPTFGASVGNKAMDSGGQPLNRNDPALHQPAQAPARHGNDLAFAEAAKSNRACVGVGRVAHPSGSQSTYTGENKQGVVNSDRTIAPHGSGNAGKSLATRPTGSPQGGGGPGSFGFRGGK
jgi:hypothetical protein